MRGGATVSELYAMPQVDWEFFNKVIEENIELSKKSKQIII